MGCQTSKSADRQHLLDIDDESILLDWISVVLIGHHGVGKNTVGNALLMKEAFTSSDSSKKHFLEAKNTIFNRHVFVTRAPGWAEDLNSDKNKKLCQVIKDSVRSVTDNGTVNGPHAIILVNKNSESAQTTKQKLKELLGDDVFQHILIVSVHVRHIIVHHNDGKQTIINRCRLHLRRCTCEDQHKMLIETIEDFIVKKHDIRFCFIRNKELNSELQLQRQELANLVDALQCKISVISASLKSNRCINERQQAKIRKLQRLLKEKEDMLRAKDEDIERLSYQNHTELSVQHEKILQHEQAEQKMKEEYDRKLAEMEKKLAEKQKECEKKDRMSENLKKDNVKPLLNKRKMEAKNGARYRGSSFELVPVTSTEKSLSGSKTVEVSDGDKRLQFLKNSRKELTERIVAVMPIADDLFQLIGEHKHEKIRQASPEYEQRRQLLDIIYKGGRELQLEFYKSLLKHEKYLVKDLEESFACMPQESKVS